jgi:glucose/arabinose dehydrogenase
MKKIVLSIVCFLFLCPVVSGYAFVFEKQSLSVGGFTVVLNVPEGMRVEFAAPLDGPRFMTKGPDNEFIIGSRASALYRLKYPYKEAETLVQLGGYYHSAAYRNGKLYAAETAGVWSAPYSGAETTLEVGDFTKLVTLPSAAKGHSSRTIVNGPDNRLYIGLGISGNCSDEYLDNSYTFEKRRGGVFVLGGSNVLHPYSSGLRNPIGLAFHPQTGVLYAANAGPDNLGYDRPPEVFAALAENSFHGMPWFQYYDGSFKSGECASSPPPRPVSDATPPAALFPARSTPEGIAFLSGSTLGTELDGSAVAAIHGSWATQPGQGAESRRPPKLSLIIFQQQKPLKVTDLVTGFQRSDGSRFARPCGVAVGGDGHIYFTSDSGEVTGVFRLVPVNPSVSSFLGLLLKDI